jgi:hypothetical protein
MIGAFTPSRISSKQPLKIVIAMLLTAGFCFAQQGPQIIRDLSLLTGKEVIVQRMPFCQPGTYTAVLTYAGKQAKVISLKPNNIPRLSEQNMKRLAPDARAMLQDTYASATILVQFEDGTQLDSCGPISPSRLADYLELAPGETLPSVSQGTTQSDPPISSVADTTSSASRQPPNLLSDDEVKHAIAGMGRDHWVSIQDMGLMAAQGNQVPAITLYMPEAVLAIKAESAKKQFIQYELSEEDKQRSLMIVAQGYAGKTISEGCTSITRIVLLSDPSGNVVKEAYLSEPLAETWRNSFGGTNRCQALRAKFSLEDVEKVRAAAPNGEFLVAVFSGTINTKMYKVKKKFQSNLKLN